ncbi:hypothetical protein ISS30_02580 [bacterium]|nr:hypothetical protein [FCB group bacterium]MBL7190555.1 hypothetical protein [bacterium]
MLVAGWRIGYEPEAISYTEAPEKLLQLIKQRYRWTRGILQSMRKHSSLLIKPIGGWKTLITMWQMVFESVIWPIANIWANAIFLFVAIWYGLSPLLLLWWIQLTVLDMIDAMYCITLEEEQLSLVPYAVLYRLMFIQIVDVTKLLGTLEELLGLQMSWGKLERIGRL